MSLTSALVLAAAAVLAALALHGWWSSRRSLPRKAAGPVQPEPGPQRERVEPTLGEMTPAGDGHALAPLATRRASARLDPLIDALATLALEAPVTGDTVLAHLPPSRRAGGKPLLVEGLDSETGEWEAPRPGARYGELQAGVQLANRSGALNEIEYSEFAQKVQALADTLGAMPELPDMLDAVARARELDAFASAHDAQLALRLQARSVAWSVGYVQQAAARRGFVAGALPGRMVIAATQEGDPPVLVLGYDAQAALAEAGELAPVRDATLSLDVAQTDAGQQPFAAWRAHAQALAQEMDALIVDDQGRELTDASFATIGAELERLYATLVEHGLAAGSASGRRLFS